MGARSRISPPRAGPPRRRRPRPRPPTGEGDLHPVEGVPVVDDARTGLGHAVGGHDVGRQLVRGLAAAEEDAGEDRGVEPPQCGRHERDVRGPVRSARPPPRRRRRIRAGRRRACRSRSNGSRRRAPDVRERQAGQPRVAGGVDAEPADVARAEAATASWVSTTPLGWPDVPDVATTSASPSSTGMPSASACCSPSEPTIAGRAQRVEHRGARRGKPGVEGSGSIAGVPDGPEGIDEADATRKVECDELRHRPVA